MIDSIKTLKRAPFAAWVLLLALLLAYPANWLRLLRPEMVIYPASLLMFSLPLLSLIAGGVLLFSPGRLVLLWRRDRLSRVVLICMVLIALIQSVLAATGHWSVEQWGATFFYLLFPLAGVAYSSELRRCFPVFFTILGIGGLLLLIVERLASVNLPIGLTGNWNWNQSLLWISLPVALGLLPLKKRGLWVLILSIVILPLTLLIFPGYWSRGTVVAALAAMVILYGLLNIPSRKWRIIVVGGCILLCGILFGLLLEFSTWSAEDYPLAGKIARDTRVQLWRGGVRMASLEWATGVGAARTEFELPLHLPGEYYISTHGSDRHPHPHNELLFYAGAFGIVGVIFAVGLTVAILRGICRAGRRDLMGRILGWGFLVLLLHGMLDVLLSEPLSGGTALLLGGCFWGYHLPEYALPYRTVRRVAGIVLILIACVAGVVTLRAGVHLHRAQCERARNEIDLAELELQRSLAIQPRAESLTFAARMALFDRKNPQEAIRLLKQLEKLRIPHYSHAAQWMGRAYAASGNVEEALRWFEREDLYFPVGALTAGLRLMVLKQMRAPRAEQLEAERDFLARLQLKDLTPDHFSLLFRYPQIDDNAIDRERILKQWEAEHGHDAR